MLTIFSTCRPLKGIYKAHQINAVTSWSLLPNTEVILFGDESEAIAQRLNIRYYPEVARDGRIPLVSDLFERIRLVARGRVLCYINADIILSPNFYDVVACVMERFDDFLMMGRRWDYLQPLPEIDFNDPNWWDKTRATVLKNGKYHTAGTDYFVFTPEVYRKVIIPDFRLGQYAWDTWLIAAAWKKFPTVDATEAVFAIHQQHERYSTESKMANVNRKLSRGVRRRVSHAKYLLKDGEIVRK